MFSKILIANRGEIACRVAATARKLGIATVAVYSDADANARHVAACDEAWRLGPPPARESYLRGDAIVEIASRTGSQAIHPGYGFLSENEAFAQACADAGIAFIGPPASAIRAMGLKAESKRLMTQAGVPTVPGYHGDDQSPALLREQADRIGYPVLIKASAGGGGKGMRIVQRRAEFDAALASCQREAAASFGNDAVLIERYLTRPRHIEIQVFADSHGGAVHLFERDCSVQRRHQKVIEEAPAPGLPQARRDAMGEAAIAAARAVGYVGAGTVEFIVDAGGEFFFMEMNTRLQVEHPVTEMITGLDLVEWQLRVAAGEPLPVRQDMLAIRGHSIEARIYAENPDKGFLPSVGTLRHLQMPPAVEFTTGLGSLRSDPAPVRIDSGVREGDPITPHYDPMIAKLIVWGADRAQAIGRMRQALQRFEVVGPATNVAFLDRLMASRSYVDADLDTALIERESKTLLAPPPPPGLRQLAVAAAAVLALEDEPARAGVPPGWAYDPWAARDGWRLNSTLSRTLSFAVGEHRHDVTVDHESADSLAVRDGEQRIRVASPSLRGRQLSLRLDDSAVIANVVADGETLHLFGPGGHLQLDYSAPLAHAGEESLDSGRLTAPMPGKVIAVMVAAGDSVARGQPLMVIEAMKMEHTIAAPADGKVEQVLYRVGDQVDEGAALVALGAG